MESPRLGIIGTAAAPNQGMGGFVAEGAHVGKQTIDDVSIPDGGRGRCTRSSSRTALVPGMTAERLIRAGTRTPLEYLLKPLKGQIAHAFRER
jgi:hypothetical protein